MPWKAEADVADRFREGRVFLAGDSAHVMPPNGGFGGNTGVQDAHNLAWKMAFALKGAAGEPLLATYERERRPVAVMTAEQAYSRYVTRTAPYLGLDGIQDVANDLNVELGYSYGNPDTVHENPRESRGREGTRAPHVWIDEGRGISTLDLYGRNFVLLSGTKGRGWNEAAASVARKHGIPVDPHVFDAYDHHGIGSSGAVLVRPDGFVSWRAAAAEQDPVASLSAALNSALYPTT